MRENYPTRPGYTRPTPRIIEQGGAGDLGLDKCKDYSTEESRMDNMGRRNATIIDGGLDPLDTEDRFNR